MTHTAHHYGFGPFAQHCRCECPSCVNVNDRRYCICPSCVCRAGEPHVLLAAVL
jgi:hypothetical protein